MNGIKKFNKEAKKYNNKQKRKSKYLMYKKIYFSILFFAMLFMAIGYAEVSNITLEIEGTGTVTPPSEIFVTDVTLANTNGNTSTAEADMESLDSIKVDVKLELNSSSNVIFNVTMMNKTNDTYYYKNTAPSKALIDSLAGTQNNMYSNSDIAYEILDLTETTSSLLGTALQPEGTVNFRVKFKYDDGVTPSSSNSILKALLKFNFSKYYTITYGANEGTGGPGIQIKPEGESIQISDVEPTRSGYKFLGWATNPNATTPEYTGGTNYNEEGNKTLYAVWKQNSGTEVTIKVGNNEPITLNKNDNWGQYLGKVVTNYKTTETSGQTEVIKIGSYNHTVSTTYRLYYIDFDNKYKDGNATIYLKADYTGNKYQTRTNGNESTSKIQNFNPALYAEGVATPSGNNMSAVTWLLDTNLWSPLKDSGDYTEIKDYVKYVVGAPSLELMVDSYNKHYNLAGESPDANARDEESSRTKLFYKYPYSNNRGYGVGPGKNTARDYYTYSEYYTVQEDSRIGTMYYPEDTSGSYWLASPAASGLSDLLRVTGTNGGYIFYSSNSSSQGLCPIVALDSNVPLALGN